MIRSNVDLPDPDLPSSATISPVRSCRSMESRTRSSSPAAPGKLLLTPLTSMSTSPVAVVGVGVVMRLAPGVLGKLEGFGGLEGVAALRKPIQAPPEQAVDADDVKAHDQDADQDARRVAAIGVWIGLNPKVSRLAQPVVQVLASF